MLDVGKNGDGRLLRGEFMVEAKTDSNFKERAGCRSWL